MRGLENKAQSYNYCLGQVLGVTISASKMIGLCEICNWTKFCLNFQFGNLEVIYFYFVDIGIGVLSDRLCMLNLNEMFVSLL